MASISRRIIFVKLKRKPVRRQTPKMEPERKPGTKNPEDDPLVGEPVKKATPLLAHHAAPEPEYRFPWKIAGLWAGALLLVALALFAATKIGTKGRVPHVETPRSAVPSTLSHPGRTDRHYGGYPGASDAPGSGGASAASSVPTVEGFLAAPFKKRKTCVVQSSAGGVADFGKCLEESRESLSGKEK